MNDLSRYHSQEQEIARLKKELKGAKAEIKSLKIKAENQNKHKTRYYKVAYKLGAGEKQAFICGDVGVSSATVTSINKLIN